MWGHATEHCYIRSTWDGYNGQLRFLSAGRGEDEKVEKGYVNVRFWRCD